MTTPLFPKKMTPTSTTLPVIFVSIVFILSITSAHSFSTDLPFQRVPDIRSNHVKTGNRNFNDENLEYAATASQLVQKHFNLSDNNWDKNLVAEVILTIDKNGRIISYGFEARSGDSLFDQHVEDAIKETGILPPFPPTIKKESLVVGLRLSPPTLTKSQLRTQEVKRRNLKKALLEEIRLEEKMKSEERIAQAAHIDQGLEKTTGIPKEIISLLNMEIARQKESDGCKKPQIDSTTQTSIPPALCKDFEVSCIARVPDFTRADRANGITDGVYIGISWLRYGSLFDSFSPTFKDNKWRDESILFTFLNINGVWEKTRASSGDRCPGEFR